MFRPANFIETAVDNVQRDLLIGSVLVVVVLFLFLFNTRTALICATAIPTSLLAAVIVLDYFGVRSTSWCWAGSPSRSARSWTTPSSTPRTSSGGCARTRSSRSPRAVADVVLDASIEVRSSVVYATFIVALVFVPLLTLSGIAGKLFAPLGLAYILAILASLVVALTLTPALCYLLLATR